MEANSCCRTLPAFQGTLCFQHILLPTILSQTSPTSRNPSPQPLFRFHIHFLILVPYNLLAFAPSTILNQLHSASLGKLFEFQVFKFSLESLRSEERWEDPLEEDMATHFSILAWTDRRVPAELGQESQASSGLRKGTPLASRVAQEIGRASCRERV